MIIGEFHLAVKKKRMKRAWLTATKGDVNISLRVPYVRSNYQHIKTAIYV